MTNCTHDWERDKGDFDYSDWTSYRSTYKCKLCGQKQGISSPGIGSIGFLDSWYKDHNHHQEELAKTTCPGCIGFHGSYPGNPRYKMHPPTKVHCGGCTCKDE